MGSRLITDYKLEPNNKSDIEIAQNRLPGIKQKTNVTNLYADGGYYGEDIKTEVNTLFLQGNQSIKSIEKKTCSEHFDA